MEEGTAMIFKTSELELYYEKTGQGKPIIFDLCNWVNVVDYYDIRAKLQRLQRNFE